MEQTTKTHLSAQRYPQIIARSFLRRMTADLVRQSLLEPRGMAGLFFKPEAIDDIH